MGVGSGREGLGVPDAAGAFDASASVDADAELAGVGLAPASVEGVAFKGAHPPTMSARPTNTARNLGAIRAKHYTEKRVVGRGGIRTYDGVALNRISNWAPKRSQRDLQGVLRSVDNILGDGAAHLLPIVTETMREVKEKIGFA